ncbi:alpha/beta hydrolase [Thermoleophilia bacterium SCSIO 60948]|nr:alpha/beta hydrolase [Thermoleophilia bacterium SCSIO 60948]
MPRTEAVESTLEVETPRGVSRAHLALTAGSRAALVLGHGAGGSVGAPDLQIARRVALEAGWSVALVEQPYRVLGRRSAPPSEHLDEAWVATLTALRTGGLAEARLVCGGRSSGARVACRTATEVDAIGVLCLAFPLITPKGVSRQAELDAAGLPVLVVQGRGDRFGVPRSNRRLARTVVRIAGDHGLKSDSGGLARAIERWIADLAAGD